MANTEITCVSSDGKSFSVKQGAWKLSDYLTEKASQLKSGETINLDKIHSEDLKSIFSFCEYNGQLSDNDKIDLELEINQKNEDIINEISSDSNKLLRCLIATEELKIPSLHKLLVEAVCDSIHEKDKETISQNWHLKNDLTPEEKADNDKATSWLLC